MVHAGAVPRPVLFTGTAGCGAKFQLQSTKFGFAAIELGFSTIQVRIATGVCCHGAGLLGEGGSAETGVVGEGCRGGCGS